MQDAEQWQEHFASRDDFNRAIERLEVVEDWRMKHMSECHPRITQAQMEGERKTSRLEGRYWALAGFTTGLGVIIGYFLAHFVPLWR